MRVGRLLGRVNDKCQVPMSHLMSFPLLNLLTAFGVSVSGVLWAHRVARKLGMEWCKQMDERLKEWHIRGGDPPTFAGLPERVDEQEVRDGVSFGDDCIAAGRPYVINLMRCAHVLLGFLESTKGSICTVGEDGSFMG